MYALSAAAEKGHRSRIGSTSHPYAVASVLALHAAARTTINGETNLGLASPLHPFLNSSSCRLTRLPNSGNARNYEKRRVRNFALVSTLTHGKQDGEPTEWTCDDKTCRFM